MTWVSVNSCMPCRPSSRGVEPAERRALVDCGFRADFGIAFGGFKQSGIGREGGREGLLPFLETKTVILEGRPEGYGNTAM
jgi:hypothetical protein